MPYNSPGNRGSGQQSKGFSLNTNHSVAVLVLAALVLLWAMRHVFGLASVTVGTN